uniref:Carotenoid oxygenase n=1 Tax=Steinernema glaseri TaxID=37863 RepID=A0A1I7Z3C5_9BILA
MLPFLLSLVLICCPFAFAQSFNGVQLGFPETWNGDKHNELYCPSKNIPRFLDGYFLCQLSASYGSASAGSGHRLNHMIDAIGAVGSFKISNGQVTFSSQYYPSRPYKIWEFYDRNMSKSSVPWAGWSDYNVSAMARWEQVPVNPDAARFHPNLDFWRVGKKILAATEAPYWVGYQFDVDSLSQFKLFPFTEKNDVFGTPNPAMIPISMSVHERRSADGLIWGSFSAMNFNEQRFFHGIFTLDDAGVRKVVGLYDYGVWDPSACGKNDEYIGDKTLLPGYVHSITSTENYIIIPITSLLINPCKFKEPPMTNARSSIQKGGLWGMDFYDMVPMRFLVFNKRTGQWTTEKPLEVFPSMFVTHQLNAFENPDGTIYADMIVYDNNDPYVKYFYTDFITKNLYPSTARILRFTLDVVEKRVMYSYLIPQETTASDFPQINHNYEGRPYQWAYMVDHPFAAGNSITKVNVDEPAGSRNKKFVADPAFVLHEPWFVPKPDASREDDGVLLIRALDLQENKGVLLVVDATTMTEVGRAHVPISVPFGFHNRFFARDELDVSDHNTRNLLHPSMALGQRTSTFSRSPSTTTSQKWTRPVTRPTTRPTTSTSTTTSTTSTTTTTTTTTETPKPPTWLPVAPVSSHKPWWERVRESTTVRPTTTSRATETVAPFTFKYRPSPPRGPLNPAPQTTYRPNLPAVYNKVEIATNTNQVPTTTESSSQFMEFYEDTLQSLCKWLPKVFKSISTDFCLESGQKAAKVSVKLHQSYLPCPVSSVDCTNSATTKSRRRRLKGDKRCRSACQLFYVVTVRLARVLRCDYSHYH